MWRFLNFSQILMDNHKLVMIPINWFLCLKYDKNIKYAWKILEFGYMHTNKNIFLLF
jgi:hypothetical protein